MFIVARRLKMGFNEDYSNQFTYPDRRKLNKQALTYFLRALDNEFHKDINERRKKLKLTLELK
jgi:hypothetical protein